MRGGFYCSGADRAGPRLPRETFEEREKKELAMAVLDNPERLLMYAQAEGDVRVTPFFAFFPTFSPPFYLSS